jgi:hypothetical protein
LKNQKNTKLSSKKCLVLGIGEKLTNIALHVAVNENHPVNKLLKDQEVYDEYALRRNLSRPSFIRAQEACATLGVDMGTVECVKELEHPPWINNNSDNMITKLIALPKGSDPARIRAELETIIEGQDFEDMLESTRTAHREVKIRLAGQMSIFNAELQAIIEAIKITRRCAEDKRIIMTDSLNNIVVQEETST